MRLHKEKIRVHLLGESSPLLKNIKTPKKRFFLHEYVFFRIVNAVTARYHPLTHVYPMIAISAPGCGRTWRPCLSTLGVPEVLMLGPSHFESRGTLYQCVGLSTLMLGEIEIH